MQRPHSDLVRINRFIAESGVTSRRKADRLIEEGRVSVNGKKLSARDIGYKINSKSDKVSIDGHPIGTAFTEKVYVMFHKPKHVITTMKDPEGRPCIADYMEEFPLRIFPVGRLDWDTEGLLLLTNDGDFANRVTHPSREVTKTYMAKVSGHPELEELDKLLEGVTIVGGTVKARLAHRLRRNTSEKYDWIRVVISEGKNRQIHQMFEKIGYDVLKLQRVAIGKLSIGNLDRGEYTLLTEKQVERIFIPELTEDDVERVSETIKKGEVRNLRAQRNQKRSRRPEGRDLR